MAEFGEIAREIIRRNLGESRFEEICQRFSLSVADRELLDELMAEWRPDYTLEDIEAFCQNYADRPGVGRVMQAWHMITQEAAQISEFRRLGRDN